MLGSLYAQDTTPTEAAPSMIPVAGDFTGAILFGRGNFLNSGIYAPPAPYVSGSTGYWTVPGNSPYNNTVGTDQNTVSNIVGAEMRYFITDQIALKLSGGAILRNTPESANLPGVIDPNVPTAAWIPDYAAVVADNRSDININLGGEYHFATKYNRLSPYAGLNIPFYYGRHSQYDPTINYSQAPFDPSYQLDVGIRHTEQIGFGIQAVAGVDYYLMEGFYFGFEIKPISYVYAYSQKIPAPGLESLEANNYSWSFFSQTFLKIGFRFQQMLI